ncbi:MAG TPA: TIGR04282 family arsenosugar biosynthesis glycosyltransferase [Gemmatimonadales bacterium]|nr:TIGR04282 family arsenosugar biosynthesis glycosyltransferase [Gemmatimonadales bacterium]
MTPSPLLSIFLKAPRPGTVKTRLAAEVGDRHALRLYRIMVGRTLAATREAGLEASIWFAPADAAAEMRHWLGAEWVLRPQASGDLGARLAAAAQMVEPGRGWLAIGADCPRLDAALLAEAGAAVAAGSLVLGPSMDGGYYLVGGRAPLPDIFRAMPWSSGQLLHATRARLSEAGVAWRELPVLRDVDTAEDARAEGLLT